MLLISSKINKSSVCGQTNLLLIKNALFSSIFLLKDSALNGFWVFLYLWTLMVWVLYEYKTSISTESECSCDFSRIMHVNDWMSPLNSKIKDDFPNVLHCHVSWSILYMIHNYIQRLTLYFVNLWLDQQMIKQGRVSRNIL